MKHLYNLLLALLALAGCQSESVAPHPGDEERKVPMAFGSQMDAERSGGNTRAASRPASDFFQEMTVYGFKTFSDAATQLVMPGYVLSYDAATANTSSTNPYGWEYVGRKGQGNIDGNTWDWEQTIHYWDFAAYDYRFMAWAKPAKDEQGNAIDWTGYPDPLVTVYPAVTIGVQSPYQITTNYNAFRSNTANLATLTVAADIEDIDHAPYVSDMEVVNPSSLYSEAQGMQSVVLRFRKPFCRVRFMLMDQYGDLSELGMEGLTTEQKVGDEVTTAASSLRSVSAAHFAPQSGDEALSVKGNVMIVNYPVLTTSTTAGGVEVSDDADRVSPSAKQQMTTPYEEDANKPASGGKFVAKGTAGTWYTFLPQRWEEPFILTITYGGIERTAAVPVAFLDWRPGYAYTYVFKVSPQEVSFQQQLYTYIHYQSGYSTTVEW